MRAKISTSFALAALLLAGSLQAGAFIFAGETNGIDIVTHPTGYDGTQSVVTVNVCIVPGSPNAAMMEVPLQNIVTAYNNLQPFTGNLLLGGANDIPPGQVDWESVALHEVGHCIGMAHPNAASESGLVGAAQNYTRATNGINNVFDINPGADGVIGSSDDIRGDDINLHWYRISDNNPFTIDDPVDSTTYARDLASLPAGHTFAANGDRQVSTLLGVPGTEAVMQQGTGADEDQRRLTHDDVATLSYGASGIDELAGTGDDYVIQLVYAGITSSGCDLNLSFNNAQTGFAVCGTGGQLITGSATHAQITSANAFFNTNFSWYFNQVLADGTFFSDGFESGDFGLWSSTAP